jgi:hypothetical protein
MQSIMDEYAFNIDALTALAKAAAKEGNKEAVGLIEAFLGAQSISTGNPAGAILGTTRRIMQAPGVSTKVAQAINAPAITTATGSALKGGAVRGAVEALNE